MEQTTELTIDQRHDILKSLKEQHLNLKDDQGAIICEKCYKVIRLSYSTSWILWAECNDCAPERCFTYDEYGKLVAEYASRLDAQEKNIAA
jgi:hypothetical protein